MPLKPGTLLGPYEILSLLGAGGMGEVYKGRDTRLDRLVALKLLAPHLTHHPESRDRFEREATTIAKLKHPHICLLYDIGKQTLSRESFEAEALPRQGLGGPGVADKDAGGQAAAGEGVEERHPVDFLVLEYLEGETLSERLKRGPLPLAEALRYAVEIADALDKAHRAGVTHRDIKPGNIMLVPTSGSGSHGMLSMPWARSGSGPGKTHGTQSVPRLPAETKLLDFGLAKLKQEVAKATIPASERPTVPGGPLTQDGTILGTLHYMAPEQLESKEVDGRADIFSFGAVVHEMVTGKKAFPGETQASIIAKILDHDPPPVSSLEPPGKLSPPALDRVVERCLAKDREDRWQAMRDVCHELQWIKDGGSQAEMLTPLTAQRKLRARMERIAAAVFLIAFLAALVPATRYFLRPAGYISPVRFSVDTPTGSSAIGPTAAQIAISPDGGRLAYLAPFNGLIHVWVRPLDSATAQVVPGTGNAISPFWSPDGRFVGFFSGGKLKKIDVSGGPAQTLCDWEIPYGGTWNEEGVIVFGRGGAGQGAGLYRVSAAGGEPTRMTTANPRGDVNHMWPYFLPDGLHFLYTVQSARPENQGIYVGALDSEQKTRLLADFSSVLYAPPGYLLFVRQGTLMAQPFDAARLELSGEAFPLAEQVAVNPGIALAGVAVSGNGVLAYRTGSSLVNTQLTWVDRGGRQLGTVGPPGAYFNPKLSPDGKRVAVEQVTSNNRDIWILEIERGVATRFTFDPAEEYDPLWSPDGQQIAFVSKQSIYQKPSSGAGTEEILLKGEVGSTAHDWSSDGQFITYRPTQGIDIWVLPLAGAPSAGPGQARKPIPFLQSEFNEVQSQISPDGKWMAYLSIESGRYEVYVQSFPKPGAKWQISTNGGVQPRWRRDGKELFYIAPDAKLMAAPIRGNGTLEVGAPQALFETRTVGGATTAAYSLQQYDIAPDGQRFLMNVGREGSTTSPITVVLNWTAGVRK